MGIRVRVRRLLEIERLRSRIAADLHDDSRIGIDSHRRFSQRLFSVKRRPGKKSPAQITVDANDENYSISSSTQKVGAIARELVDAMSDVVWSIDPKHDSLQHLIRRVEETAVGCVKQSAFNSHSMRR